MALAALVSAAAAEKPASQSATKAAERVLITRELMVANGMMGFILGFR
jgi:hypothetical protein